MKGDRFWANIEKRDAVRKAEACGEIADSMEYRRSLVEKMTRGEMTLEQVQAELAKAKRAAKRSGKMTRAEAYRRG